MKGKHSEVLSAIEEQAHDIMANRVKGLDNGLLLRFISLMQTAVLVGYPLIYEKCEVGPPKTAANLCDDLALFASEAMYNSETQVAIEAAIRAWRDWIRDPMSKDLRIAFNGTVEGLEDRVHKLGDRAVIDLDGGVLDAYIELLVTMEHIGYPRIHDESGHTLGEVHRDLSFECYDEVTSKLIGRALEVWAQWCAVV